MRTATVFGLSAAGIILYSLFRKSAAAGTLNFYPASVKKIKFEGATPIMVFGLAIQNTSNQSFTLKSIAGNLYANNYLIGNIGAFNPQVIAANSQTVIDVNVRMSLIGIVTDIINGIKNNTFSQNLELESYANVDNLQVPVNITYKIGK